MLSVLNNLLFECQHLLKSAGENFWANKIDKVLNQNITNAANEIISWYGGMGSFNDLFLSEYNGHLITKSQEKKVNKNLRMIQDKIYQEALNIQEKYWLTLKILDKSAK